jgi:hypothetical protein
MNYGISVNKKLACSVCGYKCTTLLYLIISSSFHLSYQAADNSIPYFQTLQHLKRHAGWGKNSSLLLFTQTARPRTLLKTNVHFNL